MCGQYSRKQFDRDVQKLRDLIKKCEVLLSWIPSLMRSVSSMDALNSAVDA